MICGGSKQHILLNTCSLQLPIVPLDLRKGVRAGIQDFVSMQVGMRFTGVCAKIGRLQGELVWNHGRIVSRVSSCVLVVYMHECTHANNHLTTSLKLTSKHYS